MTNTVHQEKRVDAKEVMRMWKTLPKEVQVKLFYMIEGALLIEKGQQDKRSGESA